MVQEAKSKGLGTRPNTKLVTPLLLPGYHRTKSHINVAGIGYNKIVPGFGRLYGAGFYMTQTESAQLKVNMLNYGPIIVRCEVNAAGFISFDKPAAQRIWGRNSFSLLYQLGHFGPWPDDKLATIKHYSNELQKIWNNNPTTDRRYTSEIAKKIYDYLKLDAHVSGIIYTGATDGPCIVAYDTSRVQPLSFADVPGNFKTIPIEWRDFEDNKTRYDIVSKVDIGYNVGVFMISLEAIINEKINYNDVVAAWKKAFIAIKCPAHRLAFLIAVKKLVNKKQYAIYKPALSCILDLLTPKNMIAIGVSNLPVIKTTKYVTYISDIERYRRFNNNEEDVTHVLIQSIIKRKYAIHNELYQHMIHKILFENQKSFDRLYNNLDILSVVTIRQHLEKIFKDRSKVKEYTGDKNYITRIKYTIKRINRSQTNAKIAVHRRCLGVLPIPKEMVMAALTKQLRKERMRLRKHPIIMANPELSNILKFWWQKHGRKYRDTYEKVKNVQVGV